MISNRSFDKAEQLATIFADQTACNITVLPWACAQWAEVLNRADLLVNATSLGMGGNGSVAELLPWQEISRKPVVYETIYNPLDTDLLVQARQHQFPVVEGIELLLWQAVAGFEIWTGLTAPVDVMRQNLLRGLQ